MAEQLCDTLYKCANEFMPAIQGRQETFVTEEARWEKILTNKDSKMLWQAIDRSGVYHERSNHDNISRPSDASFRDHFESLLYKDDIEMPDYEGIPVTIPVLDQNITADEVHFIIHSQLKPHKSSGPDAIPLWIFKMLPMAWLVFIAQLLNLAFSTKCPEYWKQSRLIALHKKGDTMDCENYRGISIMNSLCKIYDYVLCNRLTLWYTPRREQAGSQPGRGCVDQIVALRLICNFAVEKKKKLFLLFIDFRKAYDKLPRDKLLCCLKELGIGTRMYSAIRSLYTSTVNVIGDEETRTNCGVRQGAPSSNFLFTLYLDRLVKLFNEGCVQNGFLGWLNCLLLMDDTVIFATSRQELEVKYKILLDFCHNYGMQINETKSNFFVLNGVPLDKSPLLGGQTPIQACERYVYLGIPFAADGKCASSLKLFCQQSQKHLLKLSMFMRQNKDYPFAVKKAVLNAAFTSSILYGAESWLCYNLGHIKTLYMKALKLTLGVRESTANDLVLIETGFPPVEARVQKTQKNFFAKISNRGRSVDDPLDHILAIHRTNHTKTWAYIESVKTKPDDMTDLALENIRCRVRQSEKSKLQAYILLNPDLNIHPLYLTTHSTPEYERIAFTRLRVIAHRLKIETGRWSRIEREHRLCSCGGIQTESHVLLDCPNLIHLREQFEVVNLTIIELFKRQNITEYVYQVLLQSEN